MTYAPTQEQRDLMTILNGGDTMVNDISVKVRKLHPDAVIPQYATMGAAGFDLVAVEDVIIAPGETKKVPLGLAFEIPVGFEIQVRPRSGVSVKTKLRISNAPGTVDADFRGEVCVIIDNINPDEYGLAGDTFYLDGTKYKDGERHLDYEVGTYIVRKGDRIAQGVLAKVPRASFVEVAELDETERGAGGFGSTGITKEKATAR